MNKTTKALQIVFASAECAPFVKTGGLGDVAGSLPAALTRAGAECIVMVPKYSTIKSEYTDQMEHLTDFYVPLGWRNEYCGLEKLESDGVTYLFIDNERYFKRDYPYGHFDDGERFAFFAKAVTESLQHLPEGFECDVLHCNDWQTALSPVFLREFYQGIPLYDRVRTVFSIHNVAFQGQFTDKLLNDILGLAHIPAAAAQLRCDSRSINYMLGGLHYTDAITTVSPTYAGEIQTPEYGEGLDGILRDRSYVLQGILNGIDTKAFDPATDKRIAANYSEKNMSGKATCKAKLQEELGLEVRDDRPLMVMVTRLTRQKGLDLVMYSLDRILSNGVQVAVLGTGDADYEDGLRWFQSQYPGSMAARIEFDPTLSQRMYAGADMFLMPSKFEPCGLSQIISMRYGTLPIVRETGGLKDTVIPYNQFTGEGTGFSFTHFNGDEMGDAVFRAARLFWDDKDSWNALVRNAMEQDFSWTRSANTYIDLYLNLHPDVREEEDRLKAEKAEAEKKAAEEAAKKAEAEKKAAEQAAKEAAKKAEAEKKAAKEAAKKAEAEKKAAALKAESPKKTAAEKKTSVKTTATANDAESRLKSVAAKPAAKTAAAEKNPAASKPAAKHAKKTAAKAKPATKSEPAHAATAMATESKTAASEEPELKIAQGTKPAAHKPAHMAKPKAPASPAPTATSKAATTAAASTVKPTAKSTAEKAAPAKTASAKTAGAKKTTAKPKAAATKSTARTKSAAAKTVTVKTVSKTAAAKTTSAKTASPAKSVSTTKTAAKKTTAAAKATKTATAAPKSDSAPTASTAKSATASKSVAASAAAAPAKKPSAKNVHAAQTSVKSKAKGSSRRA